jgi:hypothetical protein
VPEGVEGVARFHAMVAAQADEPADVVARRLRGAAARSTRSGCSAAATRSISS